MTMSALIRRLLNLPCPREVEARNDAARADAERVIARAEAVLGDLTPARPPRQIYTTR